MFKYLIILGLFLSVTGCSSLAGLPPLNEPLKAHPHKSNAKRKNLLSVSPATKKSEDFTLILTFSGGGTRAAAFSYGVLKELESIPSHASAMTEPSNHSNKNTRTMLDEVDLISSVSGGSFTAAYYGLYGKRIFRDFEARFLKRPVQSSLIKYLLFSPSNWLKLAPSLYERSDLAADYYADTIFGNKRYTDMRRDGPRIVINATDLASGRGFSFTKKNFQRLCSNISNYPVGRAVVASSAVPVVFSPIVMKNYSGNCAVETNVAPNKVGRRFQSFLHLVDGGVVDNLGIRSLIHLVEEADNNFWHLMKSTHITKNHKVMFIIVNASDAIPPSIGKRRVSPGTSTTLGAVTTIQSRRYNQTTLALLKRRFSVWEEQVKKGRCAETHSPRCAEIDIQMAELNFNQLSSKESEELSLLETSLELPDDKVDQLIKAGRSLLRNSKQVQNMLKSLH